MEAIKIEILNPKALQLIKGMQDLDLIRISEKPVSKLKDQQVKSKEISFNSKLEGKYLRKHWERQLKNAIAAGDFPDDSPLEKLNNEWDNSDWTWPE